MGLLDLLTNVGSAYAIHSGQSIVGNGTTPKINPLSTQQSKLHADGDQPGYSLNGANAGLITNQYARYNDGVFNPLPQPSQLDTDGTTPVGYDTLVHTELFNRLTNIGSAYAINTSIYSNGYAVQGTTFTLGTGTTPKINLLATQQSPLHADGDQPGYSLNGANEPLVRKSYMEYNDGFFNPLPQPSQLDTNGTTPLRYNDLTHNELFTRLIDIGSAYSVNTSIYSNGYSVHGTTFTLGNGATPSINPLATQKSLLHADYDQPGYSLNGANEAAVRKDYMKYDDGVFNPLPQASTLNPYSGKAYTDAQDPTVYPPTTNHTEPTRGYFATPGTGPKKFTQPFNVDNTYLNFIKSYI